MGKIHQSGNLLGTRLPSEEKEEGEKIGHVNIGRSCLRGGRDRARDDPKDYKEDFRRTRQVERKGLGVQTAGERMFLYL